MNIVQTTAIASLSVQFLIGVIDAIGLRFKVAPRAEIFRTLLKIELTVQIIEFMAYMTLVRMFFMKDPFIKNITIIRYVDWCFTTPIMMITLMAYLSGEDKFETFLKKYKGSIAFVVMMDILMLLFGLRHELMADIQTTKCERQKWIYVGFFPFIIMFGYILHLFYEQISVSKEKTFIFAWFVGIWALYGIAAFQSYAIRNSSYNVLDIFSKNITGLFLVWKLSQYRIDK